MVVTSPQYLCNPLMFDLSSCPGGVDGGHVSPVLPVPAGGYEDLPQDPAGRRTTVHS